MAEISPSIMSADYSKIFETIRDFEGKADSVHIDVMDNEFVPNYTLDRFNPEFVEKLKGREITKNVHLMVQEHLKWAKAYCEAGSDEIAFHFETGKTKEGLELVKDYGIKAGLAIKLATPPQALEEFFPLMDFVMIMSIEPGFAGQTFKPEALPRIKWFKENFGETYGGKVWVDGGVKMGVAKQCAQAGADILVSANAIFKGPQPDFLD
ncbi:MAG TPA: ribulose-phosphate 3-epimerase, partial [Candidatus Norongarragalinales archaeon]|nr:ribulose-phosphate 3-epimerase [Candidatus Norongarragalinales archaeon]